LTKSKMRSRRLAWLPLLIVPLLSGAAPATRPTAPDSSALRKAAAGVREVFGKDLAGARTPEARVALANKLLAAADQTQDDPAARYLLLTRVADLASSAGDVGIGLKAVDRIESQWAVDGVRMRTEVLLKAAALMRRPEERLEWARNAQAVADQAAAADEYTLARQLNARATAVIEPVRNEALTKRLSAQLALFDELANSYTSLSPALAKLRTDPNDPAANLALGKFQAFTKGDWQSGLPRIAVGSDPNLKDPAIRDQAAASNPEDRVALADAWWDLADQQTGPARRNLRLRAAGWYQLAAANLSGLEKINAERRLAEATADGSTPPPVVPGDAMHGVAVENETDAREAGQVIADVQRHYPDSVRDVRQFDLLRYHDVADFRTGAAQKEIPGSYSKTPRETGGGGIQFCCIYENWEPGKYLVVYRIQTDRHIDDGTYCFLDVCVKGGTIASNKPRPDELEPGKWACIPIPVELDSEKELEYRLWPQDHLIALDRVYIFRLH
jgi:hypothetical protein